MGIDLGNFAVSSGVTCCLVTAVNGSLWWVCFENRPKPLVIFVFENRPMDNNRTSHGSREILLYLIKPWFKLNVIVKVYFPINYFHNLVS